MSRNKAPRTCMDAGYIDGVALRAAVGALMVTLLLEAMDQTIVGTAMPRIIGQLRGLDRYSWVITAYLLAATTFVPIAGGLSDQFGRKRFLVAGTVCFVLASLLCGLAQTIDQLIVFRALQGVGAGSGIALVFTAVGDLVPPIERGKWQGLVNSVYALAAIGGPTLGGWLADHGPALAPLVTEAARWRWVFYLNLPLGLLALAGLVAFLPPDHSRRGSSPDGWVAIRRIDAAGAALCAATTLTLLLGLTWGSAGVSAWGTPRVAGVLVGAILLGGAFLVAEGRATAPIMPLRLFHDQVFAATAALSLLLNMALLGMAFYAPLYLQGVLGASATQAGAAMTPFSVGIAAASFLAGLAITALKRYQGLALLGATFMTLGLFLLTRMTPATPLGAVSVSVAIAGVGMGMLFAVVGVMALNAVPATQMGAGAAAVRYIGQIGGTVGVALVAAVVNSTLVGALDRTVPRAAVRRLAADGVTIVSNPQILANPTYRAAVIRQAIVAATKRVPVGAPHGRTATAVEQAYHLVAQVFDGLRIALAEALVRGFVVTVAVAMLAILAATFLRDRPMGSPRGRGP